MKLHTKSLQEKLGYIESGKNAAFNVPLDPKLQKLFSNCDTSLSGKYQFIIWFGKEKVILEKDASQLVNALLPSGVLWICWPKKSSGIKSNLTENILREVLLPYGIVDIKVCSINNEWSGLKFVTRKVNRK